MRKHLNLIQFSRALVPFFVILLHAKAFLTTYFHYDFLHLSNVDRSGGVYYFFALSGFMVYYLYHQSFGDPSKLKEYLYHRFIRIYPLYWMITFMILPIYFIYPNLGSGNEREIGHILSSLLLFPDGRPPILGVAWSLVHTVFFYLIIGLLFFKNKWLSLFLPVLWAMLSLFFSLHILSSTNYFINYLFNFNNLIFLLGFLCAYVILRVEISVKISTIMVIIGLAGFPLAWINEQNRFLPIDLPYTTTIASVLLILGFSSLDLQKEIRIPRLAKLLGDASFSIYLTHFTSMSAISIFFSTASSLAIPNIMLAILLITASMIGGVFVYAFVEKPLYRRLRKRTKRMEIVVVQSFFSFWLC
ncbi:acyltransferase [Robertmurraya sp. FSL W8-0741]|uniref:acyltransferase family protein n=1 Tax=Robertmurraya sp. FSL W8-0741 TaxID=2954629 RepID=UPI0030FCB6F6